MYECPDSTTITVPFESRPTLLFILRRVYVSNTDLRHYLHFCRMDGPTLISYKENSINSPANATKATFVDNTSSTTEPWGWEGERRQRRGSHG